MSRRKQSNPKPIKHEGDEDESDTNREHMVENEETPSNNSNEIQPIKDPRLSEEDSKPNFAGESADSLPTGRWRDSPDVAQEDGRQQEDITGQNTYDNVWNDQNHCVSLTSARLGPFVKPGGKIDSFGRLNDEEETSDNNSEMTEEFRISIKQEPPSSPSPDKGSDSVSVSNIPHRSSSINNLNSKQRQNNRSRSRSRSKSGGIPNSPEAPPSANQAREDAERALVNQLQLPSDVLYLKQQEMNIHGTASVSWVVCSAIPLPQGSSLGPFQGQLVPSEAVNVGDLIVQFTNKKGQQALMNVAGQSGGWLALLRSAGNPSDRNTHVYWEGGRIWCEIISDIDIGSELRATFSFQNEDEDVAEEEEDEEIGAADVKENEGSSSSEVNSSIQQHHQQQHTHQQQVSPGHAALIYGCPFCGVRFSSPRTLQGHLSFYCSKKTSDLIVSPSTKEREKRNNQEKSHTEGTSVKVEPKSPSENGNIALKRQHEDSNSQSDSSDSPGHYSQAKTARLDQVFQCKHCSYKSDKLSSLNRHMRMHNNERANTGGQASAERADRASGSSSSRDSSVVKSSSSETFCKECRIQFSSLHTFRCHKEHYCAQRRKKALADPSAFAAMFHSPFTFPDAAKVGIPSALQMAALSQGGLVLPRVPGEGTVPVTAAVILAAPMMTANGMANIAISMPMLMQQMVAGQDAVAALASPRIKGSPEPRTSQPSSSQPLSSNTSSSQPSPHPPPTPVAHFLSPPPSSHTDYTRKLEELHKTKEFASVKSESTGEDHPLDLTVAKKETKYEPNGSTAESSTVTSFQPDKDGALDARRIAHAYSQASPNSSDSSSKIKDLKEEPKSPPSTANPAMRRSEQDLPGRDFTAGAAFAHLQQSEILSPDALRAHLLPQSSLLVSPAGFLPMAGLAPMPISPPNKMHAQLSPAGTPNGISKCSDCNIVFYKLDNYLIHKKHYCSGKRRLSNSQRGSTPESAPFTSELNEGRIKPDQQPPPRQRTPLRSDSEAEASTSQESVTSKHGDPVATSPKHANEIKYKFFCVPCRIKFSNANILEAHKEYYCPAGKDSEQSVILQTSSSDSNQLPSPKEEQQQASPEPPQEEFNCTRCNSIFTSARLLRLHVCDGGFPCPHCDHVAITENRLAEHMKVHAPTRAYRCTICGYRGNTARGMRMHGKTHIDEGLDFTDENMLEYHEPALVPVVHSPHAGVATDSELLRLKNEPYKRRRSRKAYEKFDFPLPKVDIPQTCPLCGQNFANAEFLASHFKVHEIAASQYMAGLMKCIHCDYVGKSPEDLRSHFEVNHTSNHRNKRQRMSSSTDDDQPCAGPSRSPGLQNSPIKSENMDTEQKIMVVTDPNSPDDEKYFNHRDRSLSPMSDRGTQKSMSPQVRIKDEPEDESENDGMDTDTLNHFLQTPKQSPESNSVGATLEAREHSRISSKHEAKQYVHSLQGQDVDEASTSSLQFPRGFQEKINSERLYEDCQINIKTEPISDETDLNSSHQQFLTSQDPSSENFNTFHARSFSPSSPSSSRKIVSSRDVSHEAQEQTKIYSGTSKMGQIDEDDHGEKSPTYKHLTIKSERESPVQKDSAPNFLVSSPQQNISDQAMSNITVKNNISPFSVFESRPSTASATTVLPAHQLQPHSIPFPYTSAHALPYLFLPPHQSASPTSPQSTVIRDDRPRYCQNCDISFSKHATYLAHKKYYCTARPRGEAQPSAKA